MNGHTPMDETFVALMGVVIITYVWQAAVWAGKRWAKRVARRR